MIVAANMAILVTFIASLCLGGTRLRQAKKPSRSIHVCLNWIEEVHASQAETKYLIDDNPDGIGFKLFGVAERSEGSQSPLGQTEKNSARANVFRVTPKSGHCATQSACLKGAQKATSMTRTETERVRPRHLRQGNRGA